MTSEKQAKYDTDVPQTTSEIVCAECETSPRLKSLDKNAGTTVGCDCDGVAYSLDSVPYEYATHHMPDEWVVIEGRTARDLAREVDAVIDAGGYECPECGDQFALAESVPPQIEKFCDVRAEPDPVELRRLDFDPYQSRQYEVVMDGLTG